MLHPHIQLFSPARKQSTLSGGISLYTSSPANSIGNEISRSSAFERISLITSCGPKCLSVPCHWAKIQLKLERERYAVM